MLPFNNSNMMKRKKKKNLIMLNKIGLCKRVECAHAHRNQGNHFSRWR